MRSSLSLSLFAHALLVLLCFLLFQQQGRDRSPRPTDWIEITTPPLPKPDQSAKKKDDEKVRNQIVQTDRGELTKQAVPDAFLSEKTQKVDRETVSRERRITMGTPPKELSSPELNPEPKQATQRPPAATEKPRPTDQANNEKKADSPELKDLKLSNLGAPILPSARFGASGAPKEWADTHRWADFGSMPEDYVKGLKESERTALNTKEYVFYGYFQRIRERLDRAWVPLLREKLVKMYRMGRNLATDMDHTTQVMVVLNPSGEIVRVKVVSESGTRDLDDAAVHAFNQAGPFPNPPKGIVDPNGEIQIPWQFILKT